MIVVGLNNLEWSDKAGVFWSFLWRLLAATAGSIIVAVIVGIFSRNAFGILSAMMGMHKYDTTIPMQALGLVMGAIVGVVLLSFLLRWLLRSKLGQYRLVLVEASEAPDTTLAGVMAETIALSSKHPKSKAP